MNKNHMLSAGYSSTVTQQFPDENVSFLYVGLETYNGHSRVESAYA